MPGTALAGQFIVSPNVYVLSQNRLWLYGFALDVPVLTMRVILAAHPRDYVTDSPGSRAPRALGEQ